MIAEVVVFESETFKALQADIAENRRASEAIWQKLNARIEDKWLTPQEAADYTGFKPAWIKARSREFKAFQDGCGLRYKRSNLDKYMEANSIGAKK